MSIFSRFKDIVTSNISSMLDSAEDPEKLIRLMLREMEETLVELKAGCAATMAEATTTRRSLEAAQSLVAQWEHRAELAFRAGREDMVHEAAAETLQARERAETLKKELTAFENLIAKCREDIQLLEERIVSTKERQRLLVERHNHAQVRIQARIRINNAENSAALHRFDLLEQRIIRMENEADLAYTQSRRNMSFKDMEQNDALEKELESIKQRVGIAKPAPESDSK